jgi:hypothetical protein
MQNYENDARYKNEQKFWVYFVLCKELGSFEILDAYTTASEILYKILNAVTGTK